MEEYPDILDMRKHVRWKDRLSTVYVFVTIQVEPNSMSPTANHMRAFWSDQPL
jgi:hypothetical protein